MDNNNSDIRSNQSHIPSELSQSSWERWIETLVPKIGMWKVQFTGRKRDLRKLNWAASVLLDQLIMAGAFSCEEDIQSWIRWRFRFFDVYKKSPGPGQSRIKTLPFLALGLPIVLGFSSPKVRSLLYTYDEIRKLIKLPILGYHSLLKLVTLDGVPKPKGLVKAILFSIKGAGAKRAFSMLLRDGLALPVQAFNPIALGILQKQCIDIKNWLSEQRFFSWMGTFPDDRLLRFLKTIPISGSLIPDNTRSTQRSRLMAVWKRQIRLLNVMMDLRHYGLHVSTFSLFGCLYVHLSVSEYGVKLFITKHPLPFKPLKRRIPLYRCSWQNSMHEQWKDLTLQGSFWKNKNWPDQAQMTVWLSPRLFKRKG